MHIFLGFLGGGGGGSKGASEIASKILYPYTTKYAFFQFCVWFIISLNCEIISLSDRWAPDVSGRPKPWLTNKQIKAYMHSCNTCYAAFK